MSSVLREQFEAVLEQYAKDNKTWTILGCHVKHLNVLLETWHNAIHLSWWERWWQTEKAKQSAVALAEGIHDAETFYFEIALEYPELAQPLSRIIATNKNLLKQRFVWYK